MRLYVMPREKNRPGFIFELKEEKDKSSTELVQLAQTALKQIEEKKYDTEMVAHGIKTIVKYGVAFSGKMVELAMA